MERYVRTCMAFSFFFLFFNSTFISRALFLNFLPTLFTNFREFQCIKINCVFHMEYSFSWKKTFRLVITSLQRGNGWNENRIPLRGISHTSGFYNLAMILFRVLSRKISVSIFSTRKKRKAHRRLWIYSTQIYRMPLFARESIPSRVEICNLE